MTTHQPFSTLLVDDNDDTKSLFQLVMDHHRLPLDVVNDAESAVDYLSSHAPTVVVVDIVLPGMDGYQLLRKIRQKSNAANCKVIATTAYYTSDTRQQIADWGFDGYLPKPLAPSTLIPYLEQIVHAGQ